MKPIEIGELLRFELYNSVTSQVVEHFNYNFVKFMKDFKDLSPLHIGTLSSMMFELMN